MIKFEQTLKKEISNAQVLANNDNNRYQVVMCTQGFFSIRHIQYLLGNNEYLILTVSPDNKQFEEIRELATRYLDRILITEPPVFDVNELCEFADELLNSGIVKFETSGADKPEPAELFPDSGDFQAEQPAEKVKIENKDFQDLANALRADDYFMSELKLRARDWKRKNWYHGTMVFAFMEFAIQEVARFIFERDDIAHYEQINELEKRRADLINCAEIQRQPGNFDSDEYQYGLANGLEMARAIMNNERAIFLTRPKVFKNQKFENRILESLLREVAERYKTTASDVERVLSLNFPHRSKTAPVKSQNKTAAESQIGYLGNTAQGGFVSDPPDAEPEDLKRKKINWFLNLETADHSYKVCTCGARQFIKPGIFIIEDYQDFIDFHYNDEYPHEFKPDAEPKVSESREFCEKMIDLEILPYVQLSPDGRERIIGLFDGLFRSFFETNSNRAGADKINSILNKGEN